MPRATATARMPDISEVKDKLQPEKVDPVRFFCTIPSGFTYCVVPSDKVLIQGTLYRQRGKYAIFHPGKALETTDPETIEVLRNHSGYGSEILEMGVHAGK